MAVADRAGLPVAVWVTGARPHEVTVEACFAPTQPEKLIGDLASDSDALDARLAARGSELIAPHRRNRRKPPTQKGRKRRRYKMALEDRASVRLAG